MPEGRERRGRLSDACGYYWSAAAAPNMCHRTAAFSITRSSRRMRSFVRRLLSHSASAGEMSAYRRPAVNVTRNSHSGIDVCSPMPINDGIRRLSSWLSCPAEKWPCDGIVHARRDARGETCISDDVSRIAISPRFRDMLLRLAGEPPEFHLSRDAAIIMLSFIMSLCMCS